MGHFRSGGVVVLADDLHCIGGGFVAEQPAFVHFIVGRLGVGCADTAHRRGSTKQFQGGASVTIDSVVVHLHWVKSELGCRLWLVSGLGGSPRSRIEQWYQMFVRSCDFCLVFYSILGRFRGNTTSELWFANT